MIWYEAVIILVALCIVGALLLPYVLVRWLENE